MTELALLRSESVGRNQPFVARGFLPHGMEPAFTSKGLVGV